MLMLCLAFGEVSLEDKGFCCRVTLTSGKTRCDFRVCFIGLTQGDRPRLKAFVRLHKNIGLFSMV